MRIVSSSMRRPREVTGSYRVCNREPDSFLQFYRQIKASPWTKDQEQWPRVQLQWKNPLVDPMITVDVT